MNEVNECERSEWHLHVNITPVAGITANEVSIWLDIGPI